MIMFHRFYLIGLSTSTGVCAGIALLPDVRSEAYFGLLRQWLKYCEDLYDDALLQCEMLPARVLDVGDPSEPRRFRIYESSLTKGRYIALSHRWSDASNKCKTTNENLSDRTGDLDIKKLSNTFQDAITVTRRLGVQFLWIDSLCIIQDDEDDWYQQAKIMEFIYAKAYCTIAVSGKDQDGVLYRSPAHFLRLGESAPYASLSKSGSDFKRDVEEAELSQRGWILQSEPYLGEPFTSPKLKHTSRLGQESGAKQTSQSSKSQPAI